MPRVLSLWLQALLPKAGVPIAKVLRSQSRRPQRGARVPASFRLGAGVFLSFTCFCDAVFCAAAQGRGRSTWGMGWRALEEPKEGWGGWEAQRLPLREGLAIGGRLVRLCVSSVTPAGCGRGLTVLGWMGCKLSKEGAAGQYAAAKVCDIHFLCHNTVIERS